MLASLGAPFYASTPIVSVAPSPLLCGFSRARAILISITLSPRSARWHRWLPWSTLACILNGRIVRSMRQSLPSRCPTSPLHSLVAPYARMVTSCRVSAHLLIRTRPRMLPMSSEVEAPERSARIRRLRRLPSPDSTARHRAASRASHASHARTFICAKRRSLTSGCARPCSTGRGGPSESRSL